MRTPVVLVVWVGGFIASQVNPEEVRDGRHTRRLLLCVS
jgi:hypothetical protein